MSSKVYPYRNGKQFEKYIGQFARVFTGFQVRDGVERGGSYRMKVVPVVYGSMSRVVASILTKRNHKTSSSIPVISVSMAGIQQDPNNNKTPFHRDQVSMYRIGKDATLDRLIGPAFIMNMNVDIMASSTEELFEIVEQILLIFNPRITIQVDTNAANADCITDIILRDIQPEINNPLSTESQIVSLTMSFEMPVRLQYPREIDYDTLIKTIHAKVLDNDIVISKLDIDENGLIEEEGVTP